jgi:superfamily II DNA or RNA helicase
MSTDTADRLTGQVDQHRNSETAVQEILAGRPHALAEARTPARGRPYQVQAADLLLATGRLLCTDDRGLGKSCTGLLALRAPDSLPALVVTLTHLPDQWLDELRLTWPGLRGHVIRSKKVYDPATVCDGVNPDVLIINYTKLADWGDFLAGKIRTVILDEAQELRHEVTFKHTAAGQIADAAAYRIGLTNTPIYNYGDEIHSVLDIIAPGALGSREEFVREWCQEGGGHNRVRDPVALGAYLRDQGLMFGRSRKDVGRELDEPLIVEETVETDPAILDRVSGDAVEMAKFILSRGESTERWRAAGELDKRLRQATGIAKAPYVAAYVKMLLHNEDKVVLWGWHRAVYQIWAELLAPFGPVFYTGTESPRQKQDSLQAFLHGTSRVLMMSLRSGVGIDGLQEYCHVGVFGELDWSPQVHRQCIGRLHRDGMVEQPAIYFMVAEDGADPAIAETLNIKRMQSDPMIDPTCASVQPVSDQGSRGRRLAETVLRRAGDVPSADGVWPLPAGGVA